MNKNRIIFLIVFTLISILIGYLGLYLVYITAPKESLLWLKYNLIWNYLIIGCFSLSNVIIGIQNGIRLSKFIQPKKEQEK